MTRAQKNIFTQAICYSFLLIIAVVIIFPIYWLIITSFKTYPEIYRWPLTYWPQEITFEHYHKIKNLNFFHYFFNSIYISLATMMISLGISLLPAWAFARYHFRGKIPLLLSVLIFQMFPMAVFLVPIFKLLNQVDLLNTQIGLVLAYLPFTTPLTIIFLHSFFVAIPKEIEEAAALDGCSVFQLFCRIIFPITLPGIASVGIYTFLFSWSELMYSMSFLIDKDVQNIPTFLSLFVGQYQTRWGPLFAGSLISMLPPLIIFILLQKFFISGLTAGAVKE